MHIELETEFAIIKSEDDTGYFISANTEDLNTLIKKIPEFQKYETNEEFWEVYSDEDARLLLSHMIASDVPFIKNGWDSLSLIGPIFTLIGTVISPNVTYPQSKLE